MPGLSPHTLAELQARGIIPPPQAQGPTNPTALRILAMQAAARSAARPQASAPPLPPQAPPPTSLQQDDAQADAALGATLPPPQNAGAPAQERGPSEPPSLLPSTRHILDVVNRHGADAGPPKAQGVFNDAAGAGEGAPAQQPPLQLPQGHMAGGGFRSTVSPETRRMYDRGLSEEREGAGELARAETAANDAGARSLDSQASAMQKMALDTTLAERTRQDALTAQADEYRALQKEAASGEVDPERWFGSHSKALSTVAMALGAFGSGLTRGRNPNWAADLVNKRIADDIDAQKTNIANKHKAVDESASLYSMKLRQFGDQRMAEMATHATMIEQYKLTAQAEAARAQSPVMAARAKELIAGLDMKQAELHRQMEAYAPAQQVGGLTPEQQKLAAAYTKDNLDKGMSADQAQRAALAAVLQQPGLFSGKVPVKADGKSPEDTAAVQEQGRAYDTAISNLEQIQSMIAAGGEADRGRTAKGQALVAGTANALARAETGGKRAPSEAEMALLEKQIPSDPNAYQWSDADKQRIATTLANVRAARDRLRGTAPAGPGPKVTPES